MDLIQQWNFFFDSFVELKWYPLKIMLPLRYTKRCLSDLGLNHLRGIKALWVLLITRWDALSANFLFCVQLLSLLDSPGMLHDKLLMLFSSSRVYTHVLMNDIPNHITHVYPFLMLV